MSRENFRTDQPGQLHRKQGQAGTKRRAGLNMNDPKTRRLLIVLVVGIILFAAGMAQHYLL